jgi:hypothetical protein
LKEKKKKSDLRSTFQSSRRTSRQLQTTIHSRANVSSTTEFLPMPTVSNPYNFRRLIRVSSQPNTYQPEAINGPTRAARRNHAQYPSASPSSVAHAQDPVTAPAPLDNQNDNQYPVPIPDIALIPIPSPLIDLSTTYVVYPDGVFTPGASKKQEKAGWE